MKIKIILASLFIAVLMPFASTYAEESATPISSLAELKSAVRETGSYRLESDITLDSNIFTLGDEFSLDLNNHTINCGDYVFVAYDGHLIIRDDSAQKGGVVTGTKITIQATKKFTLESGTIINTGSESSLAISVVASTGEAIINGGTVTGGGYYSIANRNTLTINGGTFISEDSYTLNNTAVGTATINGGVFNSKLFTIVNAGQVIMNGGTISSTGDGGYYGQTNSRFTMNGGSIKTDAYGASDAAVMLSKPGASFIMNDGEITATTFDASNPDKTGGAGVVGFKDTEVTINGGKITTHAQAISGNGSVSGGNDGTNFKVTINGGTLQSDCLAIYIPQPNGETLITGGTIIGRSGIEIRAGKLTITGGTIIGGNDPYVIKKNTNGSSTENVAISVVQHTTKLPIEVNILGGTIKANLPFVETNPLENPQQDIDKITIKIGEDDATNPPVFIAANDDISILSQDFDKFVYGGRFTHSVEQYVATRHGEIEEADSMKTVYPFREIKIEQPAEGGTIDADKVETLRGALVTVKPNPAPGYILKSIKVYDLLGNLIPVVNNQFYAPNSDVRIVAEFVVENPATTDNTTDYGAFMIICVAALACSISSIMLGRKLAAAKIRL